ncbi:hypothetical protein JTB14_022019 [Gonioctena quinquepunctata]|nr:hypothetical protein JTB14_022019 [Gonioctena quinquepunctata]
MNRKPKEKWVLGRLLAVDENPRDFRLVQAVDPDPASTVHEPGLGGLYIIRHVAVAHGRHGDHCPPERVWDRLEEGILGTGLCEVDGTREEHDTCKEEDG